MKKKKFNRCGKTGGGKSRSAVSVNVRVMCDVDVMVGDAAGRRQDAGATRELIVSVREHITRTNDRT